MIHRSERQLCLLHINYKWLSHCIRARQHASWAINHIVWFLCVLIRAAPNIKVLLHIIVSIIKYDVIGRDCATTWCIWLSTRPVDIRRLLHCGWLGQRQMHLQQICTAAYAWQAIVDNSRVSVFTLSGWCVCGGAVDVVRGQRALERAGLLSLDRLQRFWRGAQRGCAGSHRAVTQNRALDRRPWHTGARLSYRRTQRVNGDKSGLL